MVRCVGTNEQFFELFKQVELKPAMHYQFDKDHPLQEWQDAIVFVNGTKGPKKSVEQWMTSYINMVPEAIKALKNALELGTNIINARHVRLIQTLKKIGAISESKMRAEIRSEAEKNISHQVSSNNYAASYAKNFKSNLNFGGSNVSSTMKKRSYDQLSPDRRSSFTEEEDASPGSWASLSPQKGVTPCKKNNAFLNDHSKIITQLIPTSAIPKFDLDRKFGKGSINLNKKKLKDDLKLYDKPATVTSGTYQPDSIAHSSHRMNFLMDNSFYDIIGITKELFEGLPEETQKTLLLSKGIGNNGPKKVHDHHLPKQASVVPSSNENISHHHSSETVDNDDDILVYDDLDNRSHTFENKSSDKSLLKPSVSPLTQSDENFLEDLRKNSNHASMLSSANINPQGGSNDLKNLEDMSDGAVSLARPACPLTEFVNSPMTHFEKDVLSDRRQKKKIVIGATNKREDSSEELLNEVIKPVSTGNEQLNETVDHVDLQEDNVTNKNERITFKTFCKELPQKIKESIDEIKSATVGITEKIEEVIDKNKSATVGLTEKIIEAINENKSATLSLTQKLESLNQVNTGKLKSLQTLCQIGQDLLEVLKSSNAQESVSRNKSCNEDKKIEKLMDIIKELTTKKAEDENVINKLVDGNNLMQSAVKSVMELPFFLTVDLNILPLVEKFGLGNVKIYKQTDREQLINEESEMNGTEEQHIEKQKDKDEINLDNYKEEENDHSHARNCEVVVENSSE